MAIEDNISAVLSMCRSYCIESTIGFTSYYCEDTRNVKIVHYLWGVSVAPMEYIKRKLTLSDDKRYRD